MQVPGCDANSAFWYHDCEDFGVLLERVSRHDAPRLGGGDSRQRSKSGSGGTDHHLTTHYAILWGTFGRVSSVQHEAKYHIDLMAEFCASASLW